MRFVNWNSDELGRKLKQEMLLRGIALDDSVGEVMSAAAGSFAHHVGTGTSGRAARSESNASKAERQVRISIVKQERRDKKEAKDRKASLFD